VYSSELRSVCNNAEHMVLCCSEYKWSASRRTSVSRSEVLAMMSSSSLQCWSSRTVVRGEDPIVNRVLNQILNCSLLLVSDCGLLLKLCVHHCQKNVNTV
jgi:hypothetical protein